MNNLVYEIFNVRLNLNSVTPNSAGPTLTLEGGGTSLGAALQKDKIIVSIHEEMGE